VPPMIGREGIMQRLMSGLCKPTPDQLQIVGPRYAGKTVILHELERRLRDGTSPYSAVLVWDLGHQTPGTDALFMQRFAQELAEVLNARHPDYAQHLKSAADISYSDIAEVLDLLNGEGRIPAIMDGLDKPLSVGQLTRNLWDQLRELAFNPAQAGLNQ
jgi:hypothetical protein